MALAGAASQRDVAHGILLRIAAVFDVLPEEKKGEGVAAVGETASQDSPTELLLVPQLILHPVALLRGPDGLHGAVRAVKRPVKGIPLGALQVPPSEKGDSALVDAAKVVTELERIEYVEDPHLGKDSYCVVERHADGGACSVPDYAVIKLFRHIVQGEGPDTIVRGIDEAIQALPEGYDTVCTDGIFSQGEWQLLSIARAAAADPAVLLLDEITANLDAETEARVREALRQASRGRTVLSVSHRIYESLGGRTVEIRPQGQ